MNNLTLDDSGALGAMFWVATEMHFEAAVAGPSFSVSDRKVMSMGIKIFVTSDACNNIFLSCIELLSLSFVPLRGSESLSHKI